MHGLSLASGLVERALKSIEKYPVKWVRKIEVEVGELAGIGPEELRNGFSVAASGTVLEDAELMIKIKPAKIRCISCGYVGPVAPGHGGHLNISPRCPRCMGAGVEVLEGKGILLKNLDAELE
jgi:hydrogenase nickel incorporation protein HypA/HybF